MAPDEVEAGLRTDEIASGYLRPRYGEYAFANVPATAAALLGVDLGPTVPPDGIADVEGVERVVVVVIDGLGWIQWAQHVSNIRLFQTIASHGTAVPLSSVYPSETAACLTTFHTGEPPARHGLIGWSVYVDALEAVVEPLPFETTDGDSLTDHAEAVPDAELLFNAEPIYPSLQAEGVAPTAVQPAETVESPYSARALDGSSVVAYESAGGLAGAIRDKLATGTPPQYVHAYYPVADEAAHHEGTDSTAYRDAMTALATALETELVGSLDPSVSAETLILLTADHGAVNTDPATNVDLYRIDGVRDRLRATADGDVVPPAGGPRNIHLRARPGKVDTLRARLESRLDALVLDREEALDVGLFGDAEPSALFKQRLGDLLVIPKDRSVWYGGDSPGLDYIGMHGGLHPDELLVPLASARVGDLTR